MTDKLTRQLDDVSSLSSEEKMGLLKQVDQVSGTKLCHGDFHLFNLVETEDGIRILDWVDASSGISAPMWFAPISCTSVSIRKSPGSTLHYTARRAGWTEMRCFSGKR
ncbi:hypothetical protein ACPJHQ_06750 [Rossellomorea sp. H39__3]